MKLGCTAWSFGMDVPDENCIKKIASLGFKGIELFAPWGGERWYLRTVKEMYADLEKHFTDEKINELTNLVNTYNLEISQFVTKLHGLGSLEKEDQQNAFQYFEKASEIVKKLGGSLISSTSHVPFGLHYPELYRKWQEPIFIVKIPENVNWVDYWENYVTNIGRCVDIAKTHGLRYAIETHPFNVISNTDSFLRLVDSVGSKNLGVCFDTAKLFMVGEILPIALLKLRDRIFSVHIADNDGTLSSLVSAQHITPGRGKMDWKTFLKYLSFIGYEGYLSFEIMHMPKETLDEEHRRGIEFIKSVFKQL